MDTRALIEECHFILHNNIHHIIETILQGFPEKARNRIKELPLEKQLKATISNTKNWIRICQPLIIQKYPFLEGRMDENNYHKIKDFFLSLEPWQPEVNTEITIERIGEKAIWFVDFANKWEKPEIVYVPYIGWIVFGCPSSTDIDIAIFVTDSNHVDKQIDEYKLRAELQECGYDTENRKLDICLIYIEGNEIVNSGKGGKESQNIFVSTYGYHRQKYPCPDFDVLPVDIIEKISATGKFILDKLKIISEGEAYRVIRPAKIKAYKGTWNRVEFSIASIPLIISSAPDLLTSKKWRKAIKSITLKIGQIILLDHDILEYTKDGLAKLMSELYPENVDYDKIHWLLFWYEQVPVDKDGICKLLQFLFDKYKEICGANKPDSCVWTSVVLEKLQENCTTLSPTLYEEFVKSPFEPTEEFIKEFTSTYDYKDTSSMFIMENLNIDAIPENIREKHVITENQRTDVWKELLTFYKCGKNTGIKEYDGENWVHVFYNLIRGSIVEEMAINKIDWPNLFPDKRVVTSSVGLLVKEKGVMGSLGIAPDLLLILDDTIVIPVEIKCLTLDNGMKPAEDPSKDGNRDYRRGVTLATRQIESSLDILEGFQGIICLVYVYQEDGEYIYNAQITYHNQSS